MGEAAQPTELIPNSGQSAFAANKEMQLNLGAIFHEAAVGSSKEDLLELVANICRQVEAAGSYGASELAQEINKRNEKKYTPLHTAIFHRLYMQAVDY